MKRSGPGLFGTNLSKILKERGISARAASSLAEIPQSTLSQWLGGSAPTDMEAVYRLAKALDVDFTFLLLGRTDRQPKLRRLEDLFEVSDEASMSGLFRIEIKRLKPKLGE